MFFLRVFCFNACCRCCCCFTVFFVLQIVFGDFNCTIQKTQRETHVLLRKKNTHLNTHTHTNTHNCVCVFKWVCVYVNVFCVLMCCLVCVLLFFTVCLCVVFVLCVLSVLLLFMLSCFSNCKTCYTIKHAERNLCFIVQE